MCIICIYWSLKLYVMAVKGFSFPPNSAAQLKSKSWWDGKNIYAPSSWSSLTTDTLWLWEEEEENSISETWRLLGVLKCENLVLFCICHVIHRLAIVHKLSRHKIGGVQPSWGFLPLVIQVMIQHPKHKTHILSRLLLKKSSETFVLSQTYIFYTTMTSFCVDIVCCRIFSTFLHLHFVLPHADVRDGFWCLLIFWYWMKCVSRGIKNNQAKNCNTE